MGWKALLPVSSKGQEGCLAWSLPGTAILPSEPTVRSLDLGHGGHEGALVEVTLDLLHDWLLIGRVQLLGELDRLEGGEAAAHVVDHRDALCLGGSQTWETGERCSGWAAAPGGLAVKPPETPP